MITLRDVAKEAGVSLATVSNVINSRGKFSEDTRNTVEKAIEKLGYIPNQMARGLKMSTSRSIGVICEDISSGFSNQMIDGICKSIESQGYNIILTNIGINRKMDASSPFDYQSAQKKNSFKKSVQEALSQLLTARVGGIIYISVHHRDLSSILPRLDIPVVYLYGYTKDNLHCINYHDYQGARLACDALIKKGHRNIAAIAGPSDSLPVRKRLDGYCDALKENGIPYNPDYVVTGDWMHEKSYQLCEMLLALPSPPTAIFAMNDYMAYGVIDYCRDHHIAIPDTLSVIGFDNLDSSRWISPALTSIQVPLFDMGVYSAESIIALVEGKENKQNYTKLFDCSLCRRNSC